MAKRLSILAVMTAVTIAMGTSQVVGADKQPLSDDDVVIKVGDFEITKKDYTDHIRLMTALYKNRHPRQSKEKQASAVARIRMSAVDEIVSRLMLRSILDFRQGEGSFDAAEKETQTKYAAAFCRKGQTFEDLQDEMDDEGLKDVFERNFRMDAEITSALNASYSNELAVTEEDVEVANKRVQKYNERATATNELFKARASEALARLQAGEDFAKLVSEYSMSTDDGEGGECGERILSDFDDDECKMAIAQLRAGETTEILEDELGYDIYKALEVFGKDESSTGQTTWRLARIHFDKPFFFEVLPEAELREELAKEKKTALLRRLGPQMRAAAKVEFPKGKEALGR